MRRLVTGCAVLAATCHAGMLHAKDIETFELSATLKSASGPSRQDHERAMEEEDGEAVLFCRDEDEDAARLGKTEIVGQVTFSFDETTGQASLTEWDGTGKRLGDPQRPVYLLDLRYEFKDQTSPDFDSHEVEVVEARYATGSMPALTGTVEATDRTINENTGETATCRRTFRIRGGSGGDAEPLAEEDIEAEEGFIQEAIDKFREAVIQDEGQSQGWEKVKGRSASIGVRG